MSTKDEDGVMRLLENMEDIKGSILQGEVLSSMSKTKVADGQSYVNEVDHLGHTLKTIFNMIN